MIAVRCAPPWMRMLPGGARQGPCAVLPAAVPIWGRTCRFGFVGVRPAPSLLPPALRVCAMGCDGGSQSVVTMSQPFPPCKSFWRAGEAKPCGMQLRVSLCSCSSLGAAFPELSGCSNAVSVSISGCSGPCWCSRLTQQWPLAKHTVSGSPAPLATGHPGGGVAPCVAVTSKFPGPK